MLMKVLHKKPLLFQKFKNILFQITNSQSQKGVQNSAFELEKGKEPWMDNYVTYGKGSSGSPLESVNFTKEKGENTKEIVYSHGKSSDIVDESAS